jgi:hypothetical protein
MSSDNTNLNAFTNSMPSYIFTYILGPVIDHLRSKGVDVTLNELAAVLSLPPARVLPANISASYPASSSLPTSSPSTGDSAKVNKEKKGSKKPTLDAFVKDVTCQYKFTRGANPGKYCGNSVKSGDKYCDPCKKSHKSLREGEVKGEVAAAGWAPGFSAGTATSEKEIKLTEIDAERRIYVETSRNLLIRIESVPTADGGVTDKHIVLGRDFDVRTTTMSPLTPEDVEFANKNYFTINPSAIPQTLGAAPSAFPTPQLPQVSVPQLPQVSVPQLPQVSVPQTGLPAIHAVPQIPQIPQPTIPQIPKFTV